MNNKNEKDILYSLLTEFFKDKHVKRMFMFIDERMKQVKEAGFEKWIQAELMRFLCDHEKIPQNEVVKEELYEYDRRKEKEKNSIRIDLTFRAKHKQYYVPVELKHCNNFCLKKVKSDLSRLSKVKQSQSIVYFRRVFSVLFHPYIDITDINNKLQCDFSLEIPGTNLACTSFSEKL
jgi:hypothetical protein